MYVLIRKYIRRYYDSVKNLQKMMVMDVGNSNARKKEVEKRFSYVCIYICVFVCVYDDDTYDDCDLIGSG